MNLSACSAEQDMKPDNILKAGDTMPSLQMEKSRWSNWVAFEKLAINTDWCRVWPPESSPQWVQGYFIFLTEFPLLPVVLSFTEKSTRWINHTDTSEGFCWPRKSVQGAQFPQRTSPSIQTFLFLKRRYLSPWLNFSGPFAILTSLLIGFGSSFLSSSMHVIIHFFWIMLAVSLWIF